MKNRGFLLTLLTVVVATIAICFGIAFVFSLTQKAVTGNIISVKPVSQNITATGSIHSQQEVTLHFQTGGKLIFLPFKQSDTVYQGQTIAQLDTYALQKQLQIMANSYQIAANNNATVGENNQAGVVESQTRTALDSSNHSTYPNITEAQVVGDTVSRLVQNSVLSQNTAQLQVDLASYAVQLASLTAPFSGIVTAEDVTTPNVNVTTTTGFSLADPTTKVFRANVAASDIDFVSVGAKATITLDGQNKTYTGIVLTVYPQKQILASGQEVYQVDIQANGLTTMAFGQNGSVLITSNNQTNAQLVPTWAILGHISVWVWDGKSLVLRKVQLGATHGSMTEVTSGLMPTDKIITLPDIIAKQNYSLL